ncbi:SRPBCC family protein [Methylobacillus gramineus]|uniref:SRPBCC family protein n=1 Tax=Methylobacillus gramineus TaxID=755169 RepID=UPI001CFFA8B9|nr:SRPBCC family protein [Methylobacillus gramineus]MCB5185199.1 SRPBCC family protein [Methylobacillus gramineus]
MKCILAVAVAAVLSCPLMVSAALDETLRVKETVEIDAPADVVWEKIGNFGDMSWHPAVASTEIVEGKQDEVGAKRTLTLQDGGKIHEVLTARDAESKTLKYEITESVLPLRDYSATLTVQANGTKSKIVWKSMFKRQDPAHPGAAGKDDKAATDVITGIFQSGLANVKKIIK